MLSPKAKRNITRILPFGIIWLIFSVTYSLLEKGILGELGYYPSTGNPYYFSRAIIITPVSALVMGLLIGACEIFYFSKWFAQKSFAGKLFYKSVIYLAIILFFLVFTAAIGHAIELNTTVLNPTVRKYVLEFLTNYASFSVTVYMATVIFVTQFYTEVSENIGHGVLNNFLTGKYHAPTEEDRIFMFLDMKSSSTIAETLGHVKYFQMLREYYSDMSDPIINRFGEIYQYVGDEIIVSWKLGPGQKENNCIQCFFEIKAALKNQAGKYLEKFGLIPECKAGFHVGKVTAGEIGALKKEIIFTGDVLNTTSRIQGLCNVHNVDILISGDLINRLNLDSEFQVNRIGENELRGKEEKVELYSVVRS